MSKVFFPVSIACLTVSDTRNKKTDASGKFLHESIEAANHKLIETKIVKDDIYDIRAVVSQWIASEEVQVIITTGGTGVFEKDISPEAVEILFDKKIDGFGELFRYLSYEEIGTATIQSRVCAGIANNTIIFVLPGSPKACQLGWQIIEEQLDKRKKSCNFINVLFQKELFEMKLKSKE